MSFSYHQGQMWAERVPLADIAKKVGTPFYCYSTQSFENAFSAYAQAFTGLDHLVCLAVKACSNMSVLKLFASLGAGADVVSVGELKRALAAGILPQKIVFSGVGKTKQELIFALKAGILQINVESREELEMLSQIASSLGVVASIALRVNPDVDADTHHKISTGRKEDKFGIPFEHAKEMAQLATKLPHISLESLAVHIGSQLTKLAPFEAAYTKLAGLMNEIARDLGVQWRRVDLGGGIGISYHHEKFDFTMDDYARMVERIFKNFPGTFMMEPGRSLVAGAGVLVSEVILYKKGVVRDFVILDGAMNDLMRPALYDSYHRIVPLKQPAEDAPDHVVDIVGPVCETSDYLALKRKMPPVAQGDLMVILDTGAYGATMSSEYNTRPLIPEVLVHGKDFAVIRARRTIEDIIASEAIAPWL